MKGLNKRIRKARRDAGLNPTEFAKALGSSYLNVWRWERGRATPNVFVVEKAERIAAGHK